MSNASTPPARKAITKTCQGSTKSNKVSVARTKIRPPVVSWVNMIRRRLSKRSANTPPKRLKKMPGMALAAPTRPRDQGEPVIS